MSSVSTKHTTTLEDTQIVGSLLTGDDRVTASAGDPVELGQGMVQLVSGDGEVKVPVAKAPGQVMVIVNTDDNDVIVRNNADDATLTTVAANKVAMCVSTDAGDNWKAGALA